MTKTLSALLLLLVLSCAPALVAQTATTPRHPHDFVKAMTAQLGVSAEQQTQATTIFANARAGESPVHASLKSAHQGLDDAIESNNYTPEQRTTFAQFESQHSARFQRGMRAGSRANGQ